MLSVYAHEGEFSYKFDGHEILFHGAKVYVNAAASVVYGVENGEFQWDFDQISIIYVTDEDGEDLNLTTDEEKELVEELTKQNANNDDIMEQAYQCHEEYKYWNRRA